MTHACYPEVFLHLCHVFLLDAVGLFTLVNPVKPQCEFCIMILERSIQKIDSSSFSKQDSVYTAQGKDVWYPFHLYSRGSGLYSCRIVNFTVASISCIIL